MGWYYRKRGADVKPGVKTYIQKGFSPKIEGGLREEGVGDNTRVILGTLGER